MFRLRSWCRKALPTSVETDSATGAIARSSVERVSVRLRSMAVSASGGRPAGGTDVRGRAESSGRFSSLLRFGMQGLALHFAQCPLEGALKVRAAADTQAMSFTQAAG